MILKLDDVYYRYKKELPFILNGVTYEFDKGKLYAVMGGSGSGKTTLISIIANLDKPAKGKIYYDGTDISTLNADEYRANKVSVIFQNYNLLYNYTAVDNIEMILNISRNYTQKADDLLEEVGIPKEKRNYLVQNLSGGEQQRIAIARAIAANSEIILADEPTGNLDKVNSENIMRIFKDVMLKYNKCVIIVTHSDFVAGYADCILNIENGRIV
jgi:ABC-type antimicrobial peptide transport system, ATPase component